MATAPLLTDLLGVVPADQGENNLFADAGTTLGSAAAPKGSGYACLLRQQMASWRAAWSS